MIGCISDVVFETSEDKIFTFDNLNFTHSASYAEHKIINSKSLLEFTGLNPSTCSLKITLRADLGVNPAKEIKRLIEIMNTHEACAFLLGDQVQGSDLWVIENISAAYNIIASGGEILSADLTLSMKEYIS